MYYKNGVIITPNVLAEGDKATVTYKGLLYNSGAERVYMHVGYGDKWNKGTDIQMTKTEDSFEATLPITSNDKLNLAFMDGIGNWDNNSGSNYDFEVQERHIRNM